MEKDNQVLFRILAVVAITVILTIVIIAPLWFASVLGL